MTSNAEVLFNMCFVMMWKPPSFIVLIVHRRYKNSRNMTMSLIDKAGLRQKE